MTKISCRLIDYINEKLEQLEYYKRPLNPVDVLHFIKEEILVCHDYVVRLESELSTQTAEVSMLRDRVKELEDELTAAQREPLVTRCQELERDNLRLQAENERLLSRQRDLAEMGVFEDIMRHPRTV